MGQPGQPKSKYIYPTRAHTHARTRDPLYDF